MRPPAVVRLVASTALSGSTRRVCVRAVATHVPRVRVRLLRRLPGETAWSAVKTVRISGSRSTCTPRPTSAAAYRWSLAGTAAVRAAVSNVVRVTPPPKPKPKPAPQPVVPLPPPPAPDDGGSAYYANCTAARAAGVAPLYRGDPGYRRALDRDGDGVACE